MIQLNLLPDVKLQYVKAERTRGLVLSTAIIITIASIALLILLLIVGGIQKKHINDVNKDIKTYTADLKKQPEITKILTVQNQLDSLTALHAKKPAATNLFSYLNNVTPIEASITSFHIDFTTQTATITGTADSLSSVNKYVDTLKFTKYTSGDETKATPAFKDVVLSSFSLDSGSKEPKTRASYTITLSYDPIIFDITKNITLVVPTTTTTRTQPSQTADLFTASPTIEGSN
jgi:hypothetical protein